MARSAAFFFLPLLIVACVGDEPPGNGGPPPEPVPDAGGTETAPPDAKVPDAPPPLQIPKTHLVGWWNADAANVTRDPANKVFTWSDSSGEGKHALQGTGALQPVWVPSGVEGKPVIQFGGGQYLVTAALTLRAFTACVSFKSNARAIVLEQSADANTNNGFYLLSSTGATFIVRRADARIAGNLAPDWATDNAWRVTCLVSAPGTAESTNMFVDGVRMKSPDVNGTIAAADAVDQLYIGARSGPVLGLNGAIREVAVYGAAETDATVAEISKYMASQLGR